MRTSRWFCVVAALTPACAEPTLEPAGRETAALVDNTEWIQVTGEADVFDGQGGGDNSCAPDAFGPEDFGGELSFEVSTDDCQRLTVAQPALTRIWEGDAIFVRVWHEQLSAPEPAEAVLALAIAGTEVWRETIPIPQDHGGIVLGELIAERDTAEGAVVSWHVHNHGKNAYHLLEVSVGEPEG
jgi:hypothetical protein